MDCPFSAGEINSSALWQQSEEKKTWIYAQVMAFTDVGDFYALVFDAFSTENIHFLMNVFEDNIDS